MKKHWLLFIVFLAVCFTSCKKEPVEADYTNPEVTAATERVEAMVDALAGEVVFHSDVPLLVADVNGVPLSWMAETNAGDFVQVSGLKYTATVSNHSLSDVQVQRSDGTYELIDPERTYLVAVLDYCVVGDGFKDVFNECTVVQSSSVLYCDLFTNYVLNTLHGNVGEEYALPQGRVTILD